MSFFSGYRSNNGDSSSSAVVAPIVERPILTSHGMVRSVLRSMRVGQRMSIGGRSFHFHRKQGSQMVYRCTLNLDVGNLTCTAAGALQTAFSTQLSGSWGDFTSLAGVFDLYKPLSGKIRFEPYAKYNQAVLAVVPTTTCGLIVYDSDNTNANVAWASMLGYDMDAPTNALKLVNFAETWSYQYFIPKDTQYGPSGAVAEGVWLNTGSPVSTGIVYLTSTTDKVQANNAVLGMIFHTVSVEFAIRQ